MEEKAEELPFPIEDLPTFSEPLQIQEEILQTYFQEPIPFEVPLPFEEIPTEELYVERHLDIAPSFECFVQKQASYGLLDGKYLIRY
jgi:hypothetical protein